jgi:MFS family permease
VTQGLLAASVADSAPDDRRGTAFAIFDLVTGAATFVASAAAGVLWVVGGPGLTFAAGTCVAVGAILLLLLAPIVPLGNPADRNPARPAVGRDHRD